jgi:uncharacterized membrane protein
VTPPSGTLTFAAGRSLGPVLALLVLAVAAVLWSYRRSPPERRLRAALALKLVGFALLAACLLEPSWSTQHARPGANLFAVLADASRSMRLGDRGTTRSRGEILRATVAGEQRWLGRLAETFQVRRYLFDARLRRSEDFSELAFDGPASDLGGALRTLADRYRGGALAGILLFSDGNATDLGAGPLELAGLPPVYPVVMGGDAPQPDVALGALRVTETAFEDAPVTIEARWTPPARRAARSPSSCATPPARSSTPSACRSASRTKPSPRAFACAPRRPASPSTGVRRRQRARGHRRQQQPPPGRRSPRRPLPHPVRRWPPNWEYKFLRRALEGDPQVELVALMRVALREPKFVFQGRRGEASNPLFRGFGAAADEAERYDEPVLVRLGTRDASELGTGFPKSAETLFAYHALVLDDLEAGFFTADQQSFIERFVGERGGGLLMLGGQESFRQGGYDRTPIGRLLPVYLDRLAAAGVPPAVRLTLSREGWLEAWARLRDNEPAERERLAGMPAFKVLNRVRAIKPGATVLATASAGDASYPALVVQRAGEGRAAAITLGDLWRWGLRQGTQNDDLGRFWRQTVRWLVSDVPARVAVRIEPRAGASAETAVQVRVRDRLYRPAEDASVSLEITAPDGAKSSTRAEAAPGEPGLYQATLPARATGAYRVHARATAGDGTAIGDAEAGWALDLDADEHRSIRANPALLEAIARKTGGALVAREDLESFAARLPERAAPVTDTHTRPLWHSWLVLLLGLGCLAGEWALRRSRGLA